MKKSKNNVLTEDDKTPWEYQGKRRDQVESSASILSFCLILIFSLALIYLWIS